MDTCFEDPAATDTCFKDPAATDTCFKEVNAFIQVLDGSQGRFLGQSLHYCQDRDLHCHRQSQHLLFIVDSRENTMERLAINEPSLEFSAYKPNGRFDFQVSKYPRSSQIFKHGKYQSMIKKAPAKEVFLLSEFSMTNQVTMQVVGGDES
ncbi:hypothetical protein ACJRO7_006584 [Eucalyptus globulus]|uniref:Uncharacterized protein n=1 Tax=Eucalyptus globulus TaxID=34317 RepID=A0ABD3IKZ9_EUCGL